MKNQPTAGNDFRVHNLHTTPDDELSTRLALEVSGEIADKKMLEQLGTN